MLKRTLWKITLNYRLQNMHIDSRHDLGNKFTIYNKSCFDTWYMICYRLDENTIVIDKMGIE